MRSFRKYKMTANFTSIARPYALAAFEHALAKNTVPEWQSVLNKAAIVATDPQLVQFMASPEVETNQLADLFCNVLGSDLVKEQDNFIHLLAEHKRFAVLPEIAKQFKQHGEEHAKQVTVDVTSAVEFTEQQKARLKQVLEKRLKLQVTLACAIDPSLLGGAIIRAGDHVIDGSVRGKLNRLIEFI